MLKLIKQNVSTTTMAMGFQKKEKVKKKEIRVIKNLDIQTKNILIATALIGGSVRLNRSSAHFQFSFQNNYEYGFFLQKYLSNRGFCNPESSPTKFNTYSLACLEIFYTLFYKKENSKDIRHISNEISKHLNAKTLAYMFMYSGTLKNNTVEIAFNKKYSSNDLSILQNAFKNNFRLIITFSEKNNLKIETTKDVLLFLDLIRPYILSTFLPKIGETPINLENKDTLYLHLIYGPIFYSKHEIIEQLEQKAGLKIKYFCIVEYSVGFEKSAFEAFFLLETPFNYKKANLLNITDNSNSFRIPIIKEITSFKSGIVFLLKEQNINKFVFNTFPDSIILKDFLGQQQKIKTFIDTLPNVYTPMEIKSVLSNLPKDCLPTNGRFFNLF